MIPTLTISQADFALGKLSLRDVSNQQPSQLSAALKGAFTGSQHPAQSDAASMAQKADDTSEWQQATYGRNRTYGSAARSEASGASTVRSAAPWDVTQDPNRYRRAAAVGPSYTPPDKPADGGRRFPKIRAYVSAHCCLPPNKCAHPPYRNRRSPFFLFKKTWRMLMTMLRFTPGLKRTVKTKITMTMTSTPRIEKSFPLKPRTLCLIIPWGSSVHLPAALVWEG